MRFVHCNLCGGADTRELYRLQDCRFEVDDLEWPVVRCRSCGLTYLNPQPSPDTIWKYYPPAYYQGRGSGKIVERYELQAQQLRGLTPGRLLDIGCANGDWIAVMRQRGWSVSGLEPSPNSSRPSDLDIRQGTMPGDVPWADGTFDVVTSWAVFEHLHDPHAGFATAHRLLGPGGRLIIAVPNARSISSRLAYQEDVPRHLYMFTEETLARYAARHGLRLDRVEHDARWFSGAGRGVLRVQLFRLLGKPPRDYFRFVRLSRRERFRRSPVLATSLLALGAAERALLTERRVSDWRLAGHIIAHFIKPMS